MVDVCAICLEELLVKPITLSKCNHSFHLECISQWTDKNNTCPYCRCLIKESWDIKSSILNILFRKCTIILRKENLIIKNYKNILDIHFVKIKDFAIINKNILYISLRINDVLKKYHFEFLQNNHLNEFFINFKDNIFEYAKKFGH